MTIAHNIIEPIVQPIVQPLVKWLRDDPPQVSTGIGELYSAVELFSTLDLYNPDV